MNKQSEIVDLSNLANLQILQKVEQLLEESQFSKFTIILTRKQMPNDVRNSILSLPKKLKTRYSINTNSKHHIEVNSKYSINKEEVGCQEEFNDNFHIGLSFYNRGLFQNSLEILLNEEIQLKEKLKSDSVKDNQYQNVCFYVGNCYYRLKQYQKAIEYFTKKFQGEDLKQQGQKFNNLGSCYANLDQLRLSLNFYAEAYRIYQQFSQIDCSNLLNNIGMLYAQSQMFETAEKYFYQSIKQRKSKSSDSCFELYCTYQQLGNCQKHSKKYTDAINTYFQALKLSQKGIGDLSQTLTQLAKIYQLSEKWNEALDCYEKLSVNTKQKGFLFEKAAQLHRNMGHISDYDRFIKKAFQEYTIERNTRKLSELTPVVSRLTKK